jgi:hypothetical protein
MRGGNGNGNGWRGCMASSPSATASTTSSSSSAAAPSPAFFRPLLRLLPLPLASWGLMSAAASERHVLHSRDDYRPAFHEQPGVITGFRRFLNKPHANPGGSEARISTSV